MKQPRGRVFTCENQSALCYGSDWQADIDDEDNLINEGDDECPECGEKGMPREILPA